jgi:predicted Zn-dependent protease
MAAAMLNFRRRYERAADLHAIQLLKNAGFDPAGLIDYLRTLPAPEHSMLSPYPLPEHRIAAAEKAIAAR